MAGTRLARTQGTRAPDDGPGTPGMPSVKSAERTVRVLEYLAASPVPRTLRDVQRELALPRSSAYALLLTLVRCGWVETDHTGSRFRLGVRALSTGASYIEQDDMVQRAAQAMDDLSARLGETIHLARLEGAEIVYLATRPSRHSLGVNFRPGRRLPSYVTALGKALLSERTAEEVEALLPQPLTPLTPNTITEMPGLHRELRLTRERGYAIDNEESTEGIRCFAVPLRRSALPLDAISCVVPLARLAPNQEQEIVQALQEAQRLLS